MVDPPLVRDQLAKILASSVFVNSPRMCRFLTFVVDETLKGHEPQIKESSIAVEVFGKRTDYNPRADSTVRTEAIKLRAKLDRYYSSEGLSDRVIIFLPKGTYVPVFQVAAASPSVPGSNSAVSFVGIPSVPADLPGSRTSPVWLGSSIFPPVAILTILSVGIGCVFSYSWFERQQKLTQLEAKGSVLVDGQSGDDILRGIEYYRQAISVNPKSASAYAALAKGYYLLSDAYVAPRETMPKAALAADRAIELDPRLAHPHIILGMVKLEFNWDRPGAEHELKTAIALSPNDTVPHLLYGWYLMGEGRLKEALGEAQRAVAMDPSDDFALWELGLCYYVSRRYEDAAERYRRAIVLNPKWYWPHMLLGWTLEQQGKFEDALSEMMTASTLTDTPQARAALAHAQAIAGKHSEAERFIRELTELSKRRYVSPYDIATIYVALGDNERALSYLEKAYEDRSGWLPLWLRVDPKLDGIREQARFSSLLNRVASAKF